MPRGKTEAVPEITVEEHGKPVPWKDDIRRPGERPDVLAKPESTFVECRTNRAFEIGIAALYSGHAKTTLLGGQIVHRRALVPVTSCRPGLSESASPEDPARLVQHAPTRNPKKKSVFPVFC